MFNGLVPYRDLIEQKGPALYFIYGLAWLFSHDTFLGVYIIEIIAAFFYLLYSYYIFKLFVKENALVIIPIIALLTYTSKAFSLGGSAEELCLPLLTYSMLIMLRDIQGSQNSGTDLLNLGFAAGCIFWIKFTAVAFYIGWYLWAVYDSVFRGNEISIWKKTSIIAYGVLIATIPWILYFGINNSILEWLRVYLYDNLFVYTRVPAGSRFIASIPILGGLALGLGSFAKSNMGTFIILAMSFCVLIIYKRKRIAQFLLVSIICVFVLVYVGGRHYRYYSLVLDVYLAPSFALLYCMFFGETKSIQNKKLTIVSLVICLSCSFITPNRYFIGQARENLAQYQFKELILSENNGATMLNYGFLDGGFYTVTNIVPNCKAFCGLNMQLDELKELQDYYAENGLCDYIVTMSAVGEGDGKQLDLYQCIAECDSDYSGGLNTYRLYRLNTIPAGDQYQD